MYTDSFKDINSFSFEIPFGIFFVLDIIYLFIYLFIYLWMFLCLFFLQCVATFQRKSQLSKGLMDILLDDSVLPYFMEYLQKHNATDLLNFWLTSETFRLSTINRLKINSMSRLKQSNSAQKMSDSLVQSSETSSTKVTPHVSEVHTNAAASIGEGLSNDNGDEFGCFTGYTAPNEQKENNSRTAYEQDNNPGVIIICDNCGNSLDSNSFIIDVCGKCGKSINGKGNFSSRDSPDETASSVGNSNSTVCETSSASGEERNVLSAKGAWGLAASDEDTKTKAERSPSRVTFDLEPDYEDRRREFCRRRTRSIVIDAVSIYSKYMSLDASHPLALDENLRREIESE